jgi:hypothetical protein
MISLSLATPRLLDDVHLIDRLLRLLHYLSNSLLIFEKDWELVKGALLRDLGSRRS